ncbi:peptidoglycan DD-metalloendopeptidase family protein [Streptomyces pactum]|uniref:peptidoglycan DD-metalloendopeptidase family protein n=1 Tax=Streptomyces pactum TaxID=68249 RepID=UPI0036F73A3C
MVNDRHLPGSSDPADPAPDASYTPYDEGYDRQQGTQSGHDGYAAGAFDGLNGFGTGTPVGGDTYHGAGGHPSDPYDTGRYDTADPYGTTAYDPSPYDTGGYAVDAYGTGYGGNQDGGSWDSSGEWDLGAAGGQLSGADTGGYPVAGYGTAGPGPDGFGADAPGSVTFTTGTFDTGTFDTGAFTTGAFTGSGLGVSPYPGGPATATFDPAGPDTGGFDTGGVPGTGDFDTSGYDTGGYPVAAAWPETDHHLDVPGAPGARPTIPAQQRTDTTGAWDPNGHPADSGQWDTADGWGQDRPWESTGVFAATGVDTGETQVWDATAWATGDSVYEEGPATHPGGEPPAGDGADGPAARRSRSAAPGADHAPDPAADLAHPEGSADGTGRLAGDLDDGYADAYGEAYPDEYGEAYADGYGDGYGEDTDGGHPRHLSDDTSGPDGELPGADRHDDPAGGHPDGPGPDDEPVLVGAGARRETSRGRRGSGRPRTRTGARPKRSALLTVAVPSVAIMGVTAVAAATVSGMGGDGGKDDSTTQAAPDAPPVKPSVANSKLDTQLAGLSDRADDFADRASRTQERIDLQARQAAERKRKAAEAARREALRPKFALPVAQHGLSATYGQSGLNWMSLHTGIDFPVGLGTPVMAATDGTVRTQWNSAYGNMAIVTAPDGTETWYCHLGTTRVRSGSVKAGDVIAYSGDSGNSTGPHLHFEVRPGGGSAIDPLAWLRSHGLDPT